MTLPRTQLPKIGFERQKRAALLSALEPTSPGSRRSSPVFLLGMGSFCLVAVFLVFSVGGDPEAQCAQRYVPEGTEIQTTAEKSKRPVALTANNRAESLFALQEMHRLRCFRDMRLKLIEDFRPFFERSNGRVVLMDVALHPNLGDSILWRAALQLISVFGFSPQLVCSYAQRSNVDYVDNAFPVCDTTQVANLVKGGGLVLLQAGGNWGDLYRWIQDCRLGYLPHLAEAAVEHNFTIVQLPQTIAYKPGSVYVQEDDDIMARLRKDRFVLSVRQRDSLDFARRHYPSVGSFLTLDLAYFLGPRLPTRKPDYDVLVHMRTDEEVVKTDENQYAWIEAQFARANMTFSYRDWGYRLDEHRNEVSDEVHITMGDVRTSAAIDLISTGRILITNRLHGSVVGNLLGRYVFLVDTVQVCVAKGSCGCCCTIAHSYRC